MCLWSQTVLWQMYIKTNLSRLKKSNTFWRRADQQLLILEAKSMVVIFYNLWNIHMIKTNLGYYFSIKCSECFKEKPEEKKHAFKMEKIVGSQWANRMSSLVSFKLFLMSVHNKWNTFPYAATRWQTTCYYMVLGSQFCFHSAYFTSKINQ